MPVEPLAEARFPIPVVSGNHHPAFTAMCEALARDLGVGHHSLRAAQNPDGTGLGAGVLDLLARNGRVVRRNGFLEVPAV